MNELPSDRSHAISSATSSGWPFRLIAETVSFASSPPRILLDAWCIGVSMTPLHESQQAVVHGWTMESHGDMQFTRMPRSPTSFAADRERPMTAC